MTPKQTLDALGHHADWLAPATVDPNNGTNRLDVTGLDAAHLFDLARLGLEGWRVTLRPRSGSRIRIYLARPKEHQ